MKEEHKKEKGDLMIKYNSITHKMEKEAQIGCHMQTKTKYCKTSRNRKVKLDVCTKQNRKL